jgi:hypothetical protein
LAKFFQICSIRRVTVLSPQAHLNRHSESTLVFVNLCAAVSLIPVLISMFLGVILMFVLWLRRWLWLLSWDRGTFQFYGWQWRWEDAEAVFGGHQI